MEKLMREALAGWYKWSATQLQELKSDPDFSIKKFGAMIMVFFVFKVRGFLRRKYSVK